MLRRQQRLRRPIESVRTGAPTENWSETSDTAFLGGSRAFVWLPSAPIGYRYRDECPLARWALAPLARQRAAKTGQRFHLTPAGQRA